MTRTVSEHAVFRGTIKVDPYPYCPICGDSLRPDAWTSLEHFAICTSGACVDARFWRPVLSFILANIDRIPIKEHYGLHWYCPRRPTDDLLARFRIEQIAQSPTFPELIICTRSPAVT